MKIGDLICPLDYRYYLGDDELYTKISPFISYEAILKYRLKVELALLSTLVKYELCDSSYYQEIERVIKEFDIEKYIKIDDEIDHEIISIVEYIRSNVSDNIKPFVHLFATSSDIIDTANALCLREVTKKVIIPELKEIEQILISIALEYKETIQIGRTHGRHAAPITFGFVVSNYVDRLGKRILFINELTDNLKGKFSGSVGAYNSIESICKKKDIDPRDFEKEVLKYLDLTPSLCSNQIVQPEPISDYIYSLLSCLSVFANLSDDIRHLMRSEINELEFDVKSNSTRTGSSAMPHKINPRMFEHIKSMWKELLPRIITRMMDQISEHQRDLTNSASNKFIFEIVAGFIHSIIVLKNSLKLLVVNDDKMIENIQNSNDVIIAEPLYTLLALSGYPDAYKYVRNIINESDNNIGEFIRIIRNDDEILQYLNRFYSDSEINKILKGVNNTGISGRITEDVCQFWKKELSLR